MCMCFSVRVYIGIPEKENRGQLWFGQNKKLLILKGKRRMKNFKRIVSFVMAMVILASFFCYNVGAYDIVYVPYPYGATFVHRNFSDTSAFAFVRIRDWTEEETFTDIIASTYAHVNDYVDMPNFNDARAYVTLQLRLADGSLRETTVSNFSEPDEGTVDALARSAECFNYGENYSIVGFASIHEVVLYFQTYDSFTDSYRNYIDYDGPVIKIKTDD